MKKDSILIALEGNLDSELLLVPLVAFSSVSWMRQTEFRSIDYVGAEESEWLRRSQTQ